MGLAQSSAFCPSDLAMGAAECPVGGRSGLALLLGTGISLALALLSFSIIWRWRGSAGGSARRVTGTTDALAPSTPVLVAPTLVTPLPATPTLDTPTLGTSILDTPTPDISTLVLPTLATPISDAPSPDTLTPATPALVFGTMTSPASETLTLGTDTEVTPTPTTGPTVTSTPVSDTVVTPIPEPPASVTSSAETAALPRTPAAALQPHPALGPVTPTRKSRARKSLTTGRAEAAAAQVDGQEEAAAGGSAIDVAVDSGALPRSLQQWLLSGMRERSPRKETLVCVPSPGVTPASGAQLLQQPVVWDPDSVPVSQAMWRQLMQGAPLHIAEVLGAIMEATGGDGTVTPTVREVVALLQQYKSFVSPEQALVSLVQPLPSLSDLRHRLRVLQGKWFSTIHISSWPLVPQCQPQLVSAWQDTWEPWWHSPALCHQEVQDLLEGAGAPEFLHYVADILVWGNRKAETLEKGERIVQILQEGGLRVKRGRARVPAREVTFLGVRLQGNRRQIPAAAINWIVAMAPPTSREETEVFVGAVGRWQLHIPNYRQLVTPLLQLLPVNSCFHWGSAQQRAFDQLKYEVANAMALWPVCEGEGVQYILYTAGSRKGPTWSLWQKMPSKGLGQPLGFWSQDYCGSESHYSPTEKELLAAFKGVQTASVLLGPQTQLILTPCRPVLDLVLQGKVPTNHCAPKATWGEWITFIGQRARAGTSECPGILEEVRDWLMESDFGAM